MAHTMAQFAGGENDFLQACHYFTVYLYITLLTWRSKNGFLLYLIAAITNGGMAEWLKAADCKSARIAYVGSNPTPSTTLFSNSFLLIIGHGRRVAIPDTVNIASAAQPFTVWSGKTAGGSQNGMGEISPDLRKFKLFFQRRFGLYVANKPCAHRIHRRF
jgi:hypothetical protein